MMKLSVENANRVTGLIPAAGRATRLANLTFSKELLPVPAAGKTGPQLAIQNSVEFLLACGVVRQRVVIAPSKKDISEFLGDGKHFGAEISYTKITDSPSVPHSLDAAFDSFADGDVILAFPDIMFEPRAAIASLIAGWSADDCDVLLPLVPSNRGDKVDLVRAGDDGTVSEIVPKPGPGECGWTWVAAAWSPAFSSFMHRFLASADTSNNYSSRAELYVGDVLNAAIVSGLSVRAEKFESGATIDIGTPDDLAAAWEHAGSELPARVAAVLRKI